MSVRTFISVYCISFFCFGLSFVGQAQIVDDSTRLIYNPTTTRIIYEQDFLRGNYDSRIIDTTLTNMHRERHWYRDTTFYQDLGNVGTAAFPVLWRFPDRIGVRLGKYVFDRYAFDPDSLPYFDTKSPYSHLKYVQGMNGQQIFEAKYSRNVSPFWNFGFAYDRMVGTKQIGPAGIREGQVDRLGLLAFTHFQTKDSLYHLFANVMHHNHLLIETGGVRPMQTELTDSRDSLGLFLFDESKIFLTQAANREIRTRFHLTHFYNLEGESLKLFHVFNSRLQKNFFSDNELPYESDTLLFYPRTLLDTVRTNELTRYFEMENTLGVTGNSDVYFYKLYLKRRSVRYTNSAHGTLKVPDLNRMVERRLSQNFGGLQTRVNLPNNFFLSVNGEFQFSGDYQAHVEGGLKFLSLSRSMISYEPSLTQQAYVSNHYWWRNSFNKSLADQTAVHLNRKFAGQDLKLDVAYNRITNYIYFNQSAEPEQLNRTMQLFSATLHHHYVWRNFHFDHILAYTNTRDAPVIRVPTWLVNSKIYYEGSIFREALFGQIGVDTYLTSPYFANRYAPVTQQFYLQNDYQTSFYPVVDLFLTADIKAVNLFVKLQHANEQLLAPGYIVTPLYPGMRRSFVFGVKWIFFD